MLASEQNNKNIPNIVNDKKELKLKLGRMGFQTKKLESISQKNLKFT